MRSAGAAWVMAGLVWAAACDPEVPEGSGETTDGGSTSSDETSTGGDESTTTVAADTGESSGDDSSDDGSSGGEPVSCAAPVLDETFELDPSGVDGQIQPGVTFDAAADGVWVTYNVPSADGSGKFDVMATRIGCDGAAQLEPTLVNRTSGDNDIDPELARVGDDIVVVWSSDDGSGGDGNLSIRMQTLDLEGQPQLQQDEVLATTIDGNAFVGSAWMPRLASHTMGGLAVVGTRAVEQAAAFQVFVQRIDADAQPLGDTIAFAPIVDVFHDTPHAVIDQAGDVTATWVRTEDFELRQVEVGRAEGDVFDDANPMLALDEAAQGPALSATDHGVLLAVGQPQGSGGRIRVSRAAPADATEPAHFGDGSSIDHTPAIVGIPGGAAVLWYRNLGGLANALWIARLDDDGVALTAGEPVEIPDAVAAPYATTMTHVGDAVVFIAWAQGDSPNFRIYGRFVALQ